MRRSLLTLCAATLALLVAPTLPASAQLAGSDSAPGSSCAGFPQGATRVTADADLDGAQVVLICDGTTWNAMAGGGFTAPPNLIHHWTLDDIASPAADSVGSLDGTWTNNPVYNASGILDGSLEFDQTNQNYVSIPDTGNVFQTVPFTAAAWIRMDQLPSVAAESMYVFRLRH